MLYISTRGNAPARAFGEILLEGLAPDGGLYVPESYPKVDLAFLRNLPYADLASELLSKFIDGQVGAETGNGLQLIERPSGVAQAAP